VNNSLDVRENDEHDLDFALYLSHFLVSVSLGIPCMAHVFLPERLPNLCQGLHCTFSNTCTKFDAVPLSDLLQNHIRPGT
jgi:hypothetical protein